MVKKLRQVPLVYKQYTKFNGFYPPPEPTTSNEILKQVLKYLTDYKEQHVEKVRNPLLVKVEADYNHVVHIPNQGGTAPTTTGNASPANLASQFTQYARFAPVLRQIASNIGNQPAVPTSSVPVMSRGQKAAATRAQNNAALLAAVNQRIQQEDTSSLPVVLPTTNYYSSTWDSSIFNTTSSNLLSPTKQDIENAKKKKKGK